MQTVNRQIITIDLKKPSLIQLPQFIQGDTNILEIIIKEDGVDADLNNIGRIVASYRRPDGEEFSRLLTSTDNIVVYKLGVEENEVKGYGEVDVKFFSSDNLERISTKRFKVSLAESIGTGTIYENNGELTLLQELFVEVESIKQSAENEDARIENESQRQDAEAERNTKEIERQLAETSRIEAESTRLTSEQTRETNEAIRQQQEAARQNNTAQIISEAQQAILNTEIVTQYATESGEYAVGKGNEAQALGLYAKQQGDRAQQIVDENKTIWLKPVATFAAIATTYPNPVFGSKVITMDDQKEYRFTTIWEWTGIYSSNGVTALQAQLADANRQSQVLTHGTSIFASALNSPVEFEIQGRTLVSLGNSYLEGNKMYVLADKKTWIRAEGKEGTLIKGVSKFTKSASLISKADFAGKVAGSVLENAHIAKYAISPTLQAPSAFTSEFSTLGYGRLNTLNGTSEVLSNSTNGNIVQMLFSKNVIEHIERKHGRIPSDTVAGKVQWIKDNVQRLTANWHGWGSSVGGNWANVDIWYPVSNKWYRDLHGGGINSLGVNSASSPSKVTVGSSTITDKIDSNGFFHILAHANPSDGTTPSQLNTDFIELDVELKSTAVLDTRPIITRVATFEGKQSGSNVENPHTFKHGNRTALDAPSNWTTEFDTASYDKINKLDGTVRTTSTTNSGQYATHLQSVNLIEEVERIGRIPKATVPEKRQWCIDNVLEIIGDWWGFGSSVGGNKANFSMWNHNTKSWLAPITHPYSAVAKTSPWSSKSLMNYVDDIGFVHFLAYAEPSDGVIASTINTDYFEFRFEFKQGATLHDPILPLYEVPVEDYNKVLVDWNEAEVLNRYPKVQSSQHLQNLAVIAEGENLADIETSSFLTTRANTTIVNDGGVKAFKIDNVDGVDLDKNLWGNSKYLPNTQYTFSLMTRYTGNRCGVRITYTDGTYSSDIYASNAGYSEITLTSALGKTVLALGVTYSPKGGTLYIDIDSFMVNLGATKKPYVKRNPSYLFAPVKLGQIGTVKDSLFKQDGQWQLVERVRKDVVLDGSLAWQDSANYTGFKRASGMGLAPNSLNSHHSNIFAIKYDGAKMDVSANWGDRDLVRIELNNFYVVVKNTDSGFGEMYRPLPDEWKAYFNGWQAKTVDANGKPTAWRSLGDGTDAPTQTLAYVSANKAANFTPYKLSYVLANPQTTNVNHLVEGDIAISGSTQVEVTSGVVVREKIIPQLAVTNYYINEKGFVTNAVDSPLKNKSDKFLRIYKNGLEDKTWTVATSSQNQNGFAYAQTAKENVDSTAVYEVSYIILDRHLHTVNATEVKASYSGSLKDTVDMNNEKLSDVATQTSINTNLIYRLLLQAKANNWSV
jgi:hypothetical protein